MLLKSLKLCPICSRVELAAQNPLALHFARFLIRNGHVYYSIGSSDTLILNGKCVSLEDGVAELKITSLVFPSSYRGEY